jgi:hypothetical protein
LSTNNTNGHERAVGAAANPLKNPQYFNVIPEARAASCPATVFYAAKGC